MARRKKRLDELLLEAGLIAEADLNRMLTLQQRRGGQLSTLLIEQKLVPEEAIALCFCQYLHVPALHLKRFTLNPELKKLMPEHVVRHYRLLPISQVSNTLTVAMSDPLNVLSVDDIKALTGYEVVCVVALYSDIGQEIDRYYRPAPEAPKEERTLESFVQEISDENIEIVKLADQIDISEVMRSSEAAPLVKMLDALIAEALLKRASDIHVEPYEKNVRVRYRIDGALIEAARLPKKIQNAITARIKIMSTLDITQRLIPQDGRFKVRMQGKEIDFRVSILPVSFGEKVVMRALDKANLTIGLEALGFLPQAMQAFASAVQRPYGMILVTGPTGSGKSTTLYSVLNKLNTSDRNLITVEDPVEYQVEGITQVQTKADIGLTFASALRSILRQSPDILMVGEIRDFETADIAIKAALTGALLLSTLHTNDAPGAVTRLADMGVEPFLVASSVIAVAAQRLARKLCDKCKEAYILPKEVCQRMQLPPESAGATVYRSRGCDACGKTGYKGRFAMLEVMNVEDKIQEMIMRRCSSDEMKRYARQQLGMLTLRDTGLINFLEGKTSLEEVLRVTSTE